MFQVPTKTQYAIRALVHLVRHGAASAGAIAEAEHISPKYLEGILAQLKAAGLVMSDRGRMGGYRLTRNPFTIPMLDVVKAMEGEVRLVECVGEGGACFAASGCLPRKFWLGLKQTVDTYLTSVSLGDIAEVDSSEGIPSVADRQASQTQIKE